MRRCRIRNNAVDAAPTKAMSSSNSGESPVAGSSAALMTLALALPEYGAPRSPR
ncbi:MAG: hypothetical protein U0694_12825 [Anaerolineae bacterium]